jgi:hypothetical protein
MVRDNRTNSGLDVREAIEEDSVILVFVGRTDGSQGAVSVKYDTRSNGGASGGTDFAATPGTLTWADGDTDSKLIEVEIFCDEVAEAMKILQFD